MKYFVLIFTLFFFNCKKPFSDLYAINDTELVSNGTGVCLLASVSSSNLIKVEESASLIYQDVSFGMATNIVRNDYILNKSKSILRVNVNDTLFIFDGDSIFLNKMTKFVERIVTTKKPLELEFDEFEYRFIYKDSLLASRLLYVNRDTIPYYESNYSYLSNRLQKIEMYFKPNNTLIFESNFQYENTIEVKPWVYFYTDFFGLANHMLILNFGKMSTGLLNKIESNYYSNQGAQKLGEWKTVFSNYKLSKDKYVLKVSSSGQRIQSLPFLFQNAEFKYKCKE